MNHQVILLILNFRLHPHFVAIEDALACKWLFWTGKSYNAQAMKINEYSSTHSVYILPTVACCLQASKEHLQ
jgi:hypothetical protein